MAKLRCAEPAALRKPPHPRFCLVKMLSYRRYWIILNNLLQNQTTEQFSDDDDAFFNCYEGGVHIEDMLMAYVRSHIGDFLFHSPLSR